MVHNDETEQLHNIIRQHFIEIPQVTVDIGLRTVMKEV